MIPKKILTDPEYIKSLLPVEFPINIKKNPMINNNENGIEVKKVPGIRFCDIDSIVLKSKGYTIKLFSVIVD